MGAWGEKAFQNDSALDWLAELEGGGVTTLRDTLSRVADAGEGDSVDMDDGTSAIAAAEIVAAALGQGRDRVTKEAISWLVANEGSVVAEDLALAKRAVERVLSERSELRALWDEDENGPDTAWHANVRELLTRLAGNDGPAQSTEPTADVREPQPRGPAGEREKEVLVAFLRARGLEPTEQQMGRIRASHDATELRRWLARALDAPSVAVVLDGGPSPARNPT